MPGWGDAVGKIFDWLPGKKEAKLNEIAKLQRQNDEYQKEIPMSAVTSGKYILNADRIKRLHEELARIS